MDHKPIWGIRIKNDIEYIINKSSKVNNEQLEKLKKISSEIGLIKNNIEMEVIKVDIIISIRD